MYESLAPLVQEIAENMPKVHEAGKAVGRKEEHDAFWDDYQGNGALISYDGAFAGVRWNEKNFTPTRNINCSRAQSIFWNSSRLNIDLVEHLSKLGVSFDTSACATFNQAFVYSSIKRVGVIDARNAKGNLQDTFSNSKIVTIDKFIVSEANTKYPNTFKQCTSLENITFEGVIEGNIDFQHSTKLTKASIESIMSHLSQNATFTVTLPQTAVNNAFTTEEWQAVINAKPANVTVSLI